MGSTLQAMASGKTRLALRWRGSSGVNWWLADKCWEPWAAHASGLIRRRELPPAADELKRGWCRLVARLRRPEGIPTGPPSVVVKSFPLYLVRQVLLRCYIYHGETELRHLEQARQKALPVPEILGYAEHRILGLALRNTAVMMEDLGERRTVSEFLHGNPTAAEVRAALGTVADLILRLHAAGCNHIDLNCHNLLLPKEGEKEGRVIDFMFVRFHPSLSPDVLRFMVAYFSRSVAHLLPAATLRPWGNDVLARGNAGPDLDRWQEFATNRELPLPSRRRRLALE